MTKKVSETTNTGEVTDSQKDGEAALQEQIALLQQSVSEGLGDLSGSDRNLVKLKDKNSEVLVNEPAFTLDTIPESAKLAASAEASSAALAGLGAYSQKTGIQINLDPSLKKQFDDLNEAMRHQESGQRPVRTVIGTAQVAYPMEIKTKPASLYPQQGKTFLRERADRIMCGLFGGTPGKVTPARYLLANRDRNNPQYKDNPRYEHSLAARIYQAACKRGHDQKTLVWVAEKLWMFFATDVSDSIKVAKTRDYQEQFDSNPNSPIIAALNLFLDRQTIKHIATSAKFENCAATDVIRSVMEIYVEETEPQNQEEAI